MKIRKILNFPLVGRFNPGYIESARTQYKNQNAGEEPTRIELPSRVVSEGMEEIGKDIHNFETMFGMEIVIAPEQRDDIFRIVGEEEFHV